MDRNERKNYHTKSEIRMSDDPQKTTNTSGGLVNSGKIDTSGGDVIGRDKITHGDEVHGDKYVITPAPVVDPRTPREQRNHAALRDAVRVFWVDGVLKNSLYNELLIRLDLDQQPGAVNRPWNLIQQQPNQPDRTIAKDKQISDIFNQMGRQMLILGAPGSGKTVTLLTLAEALLAECAADPTLPTPVLFNLSSWVEKQPPLDEWLVEELNQRYHMPPKVAQGWVDNDELLLLLDGLDEVAAEKRDDCVTAINAFRQEHVVNMVVCSRIEEYDALTERLNLNGAIAIRPLTEQQIDAYIASAEPHLFSLKQALTNSTDLRELAQTPLMLSVMTLTYHDRHTENETEQPTNRDEREQLFDAYIRRMFQHRDLPLYYTPAKTLHWLQWLGKQMAKYSQTVFYIERFQPKWLGRNSDRNLYKLVVGQFFGLFLGLILWLLLGWIYGPVFGVIIGLFLALILRMDDNSIEIHDKMNFSWRNGLIVGLIAGLSAGVNIGLIVGAYVGLNAALRAGLSSCVIFALIFGALGGQRELKFWDDIKQNQKDIQVFWRIVILMFLWIAGLVISLSSGLDSQLFVGLISGTILGLMIWLIGKTRSLASETRTTPNQGIWQSLRNGVAIGAITTLVFGGIQFLGGIPLTRISFASVWASALMYGVMAGVIAALNFGVYPCIEHLILRSLLFRANHIPWNYARFLDYAAARLFLRKVGGGYIFVHRMVLEHIAALTDADIARITDGVGRDS